MKYDVESINKRKNKTKTIKKIVEIIAIILIYNIILIIVSSINGKNFNILGYKAYIVTTDSMQPSINAGDIVIVKNGKKDKIRQGDVITFNQNDEVITHRVIKNITEESNVEYITKGDNNNTEDTFKVKYDDVIGKVIITIPYLGKIISILDNKIIILILLLVILIIVFIKIEKNEKLENRREKKKIEKNEKV